MRRRVGWIGALLLGLVAGTTLLTVLTPTGRYIARAAWEEARILARRQPIAKLVADSSVPAATRAKLALVLDARAFAAESLGLPAKDAFTAFTQLDSDTLVLVLSGTRKDALVAATWWFPVVGRVPYKGFFDVEAARRAERALADRGFDTYLRPAPAFSTLGWFNDPLLSTTLSADSVSIVQTVIHELVHNRLYLKGEAVFNESLAEFVGNRGAVEYFQARGDTVLARVAEARWRDDLRLGRAWERGYSALDSAFRAHPYAADASARGGDVEPDVRARRLEGRDTVYARLRRYLVDSIGPQLETIDASYAARMRLDNAALLARRIYATGLGDFEAVWSGHAQGVRRALDAILAVVGRDRPPFDAVRALARPD